MTSISCSNETNQTVGHAGFQYMITEKVLHGGVLGVTTIMGLVGNMVNIWFFAGNNIWPRIRHYLVGIALWDMVLLSTAAYVFVVPSVCSILDKHHCPAQLPPRNYPIVYAVMSIALTTRIWVTAVLTIERYMAICKPLKHRKIITGRYSLFKLLVVISLVGVISNVSRPFEISVYSCYVNGQIAPTEYIGPSDLVLDSFYFIAYRICICICLMYLGPLALMYILTIHMIISINSKKILREPTTNTENHLMMPQSTSLMPRMLRASKELAFGTETTATGAKTSLMSNVSDPERLKRRTNNRTGAVNSALIVMLLTSSIAYSMPAITNVWEVILRNTMDPGDSVNTSLLYFTLVSNVMVAANSAVTFYLYCMIGKRFRQQVNNKLRCRQHQPNRRSDDSPAVNVSASVNQPSGRKQTSSRGQI